MIIEQRGRERSALQSQGAPGHVGTQDRPHVCDVKVASKLQWGKIFTEMMKKKRGKIVIIRIY